ncbi:Panacea domain-containing protein [Nocardia alni]|uniref:Panacea domain-containing protein n=1 Tax=Nocardia alni TaxID=2815723 RepID=UPI001C232E21|nr:type II toxin-antitoxin system antitoxin SocA domain-containing protein [Nocardia alni]
MARKGLTAIEIARWFVSWADEGAEATLTNLEVQKLLFYAQVKRIEETGEPLFADQIEAWAHGPVVPAVYHALKQYGSSPIPPERFADPFDWGDFEDVEKTLLATWDRYGVYAAWALREMTHREPAWIEAFDTGPNTPITVERIKAYHRA